MKLWKILPHYNALKGKVYLSLAEDKHKISENQRMLANPESKILCVSTYFFNESGNTVYTYFTERVSLELRLKLGKAAEARAEPVFCWPSWLSSLAPGN